MTYYLNNTFLYGLFFFMFDDDDDGDDDDDVDDELFLWYGWPTKDV